MVLPSKYLNKKRTLIVCAFFVVSCSPATEPNNQTIASDNAQTQQEQVELKKQADIAQQMPLLSLQELLAADDVKTALAAAAEQNDEEALRYWQDALLKASDEVRLAESERRLIEGKQGIAFLSFQGMKTNYQTEFEDAFFNFKDLDAVYAKYPAFKNAQARSKTLVEKRDALIQEVVAELNAQGFEGNALEEARRQWRNYAIANMPQDKTLN